MRLLSYETPDGWRGAIVVERDGDRPTRAVDLHAAADGRMASVRDLLEAGPSAAAALSEVAAQVAELQFELLLDCAELTIGPPVPDPDKIVCLGLNYSDHAAEAGLPVPSAPMLFAKYRNALIGPDQPLFLPVSEVSDQVDYEGELAAIVGRSARDVAVDEALSCIAGYTVLNDISARDLQTETSQWLAGKSLDGFAPCGPVLVTADELPDPQALHLETRVNGEVVQSASTELMIYSVADAISFISRVMTLVPGDVVATGTPAGVGSRRTPPVFLADGDTVEVSIPGIGSVATPVLAAARRPALAA
jgi:2-keto-4-pentenoate hydratase/2-oxohepta-3-ene-1,7-dioic acid hydratase in catechol pathway